VRKALIAGNWKMFKLVGEAVKVLESLKPLVADVADVEIVVCPPFTALDAAGKSLAGSNIALGAQNTYKKAEGACTGEISPQMLLDVGCAWVIIGHSERRRDFGETDALLNEKLKFALKSGLRVMFCVGETREERESGQMMGVLTRQVSEGLAGLTSDALEQVALAYEPVWAIGTGVNATPEQAQEVHAFVRDLVSRMFDATTAARLRIQYGGSVNQDNAANLYAKPDVDGFLVGGASLDAAKFAAVVKAGVAK